MSSKQWQKSSPRGKGQHMKTDQDKDRNRPEQRTGSTFRWCSRTTGIYSTRLRISQYHHRLGRMAPSLTTLEQALKVTKELVKK